NLDFPDFNSLVELKAFFLFFALNLAEGIGFSLQFSSSFFLLFVFSLQRFKLLANFCKNLEGSLLFGFETLYTETRTLVAFFVLLNLFAQVIGTIVQVL